MPRPLYFTPCPLSLVPCLFSLQHPLLSLLEIIKDKTAQLIKGSIESPAVVGFCKGPHKTLELGIAGDHEGGDFDLQLFALGCQVEAFAGDLSVETKGILVIFFSFL